ncbi:5-formyltetrahydrofolate cyclo-ligase [Peptoclostridium acidaminophilum DSM 3953]|uniref:5-formyltetrahydrofolate cyclo-ligase n=1 Tax=Peptoclostridium acidaminophilum DSM 3953 TaxID=1286171 RepID=W8TD29_PEPAC|nr:5-formyltetrahydrofolate cyclo-ligase [Peptoclostridium acidaminophilum]AHM55713.1 5-formyltetrahydrofolate cyclo-ligase [Peptoclostridium acidaminophilum DSM 3953]
MMSKSEFRNKAIADRERQSSEEVELKSQKIFEKLTSLDCIRKARSIMTYIDFRNEVQTRQLIDYCLSNDKNVVIPISVFKGRQLIPSLLKDPDSELQISKYGLLEPKPEYVRVFDKEKLDVIIVPGVAFDKYGYRVGYGAGFYDRFLSSIDNGAVVSVGVAFELQLHDSVPHDAFDATVDMVVTEDRIIKICNKG